MDAVIVLGFFSLLAILAPRFGVDSRQLHSVRKERHELRLADDIASHGALEIENRRTDR